MGKGKGDPNGKNMKAPMVLGRGGGGDGVRRRRLQKKAREARGKGRAAAPQCIHPRPQCARLRFRAPRITRAARSRWCDLFFHRKKSAEALCPALKRLRSSCVRCA